MRRMTFQFSTRILFTVALILYCMDVSPAEAEEPSLETSQATINPALSLEDAVAWLEQESQRMINAGRREMHDGAAAFPPQVGIGYEAFWLRDYAYMLEGFSQGFSDQEMP